MPDVTPTLGKQHAVPQHITAFEFKLVGDLTIRQFLYAGVGLAVAYAAFVTNLNIVIKWLIIGVSVILGVGTAFVPIQDRTLDKWVINFFRAIFSPTQRVWIKNPDVPEYLAEDYAKFLTQQVLSMTPPQNRQKLSQYLKAEENRQSLIDLEDEALLKKMNFDIPLPLSVEVSEEPAKKEEVVHSQKMDMPEKSIQKEITIIRNVTPGRLINLPPIEGTINVSGEKTTAALSAPKEIKLEVPVPKETPPPVQTPKPTEPPKPLTDRVVLPKIISEVKKEKPTLILSPNNFELERQNKDLEEKLRLAESQIKELSNKQKNLSEQSEQFRQQMLKKEAEKKERIIEPPPPSPIKEQRFIKPEQVKIVKEVVEIKPIEPMTLEKGAPNIINGLVKDSQGHFLENAVVIVKDENGDPVRALKTNTLGQFRISTPLENGEYTIEINSKGRQFDIIKITTKGSNLPPLEFKQRYDRS